MSVHDIDVDDGAAAALGCSNFIGDVGKVGGENGEGNSIIRARFEVHGSRY